MKSGRDWLLSFFGAYPTSFCFGAFALVPQAFWQQDEALDPSDCFVGGQRTARGKAMVPLWDILDG